MGSSFFFLGGWTTVPGNKQDMADTTHKMPRRVGSDNWLRSRRKRPQADRANETAEGDSSPPDSTVLVNSTSTRPGGSWLHSHRGSSSSSELSAQASDQPRKTLHRWIQPEALPSPVQLTSRLAICRAAPHPPHRSTQTIQPKSFSASADRIPSKNRAVGTSHVSPAEERERR